MNDFDVTVTRTINAPPDRVWAALTDPEQVATWMMGTQVTSTWERGAPITWSGEYDGKRYTDRGEVLEVEQNKRLVHTHFSAMSGAEDRPENYHRLEWRLNDERDGTTTLTLVQSGAGSQEEADQFEQSWGSMLDGLRETAQG